MDEAAGQQHSGQHVIIGVVRVLRPPMKVRQGMRICITEMHFGAGVAAWSYIPEETGKLHLQ